MISTHDVSLLGRPWQSTLARTGLELPRDNTENEDVIFRTILFINISGTEDHFAAREFLTYLMRAFIRVVARDFWPLTLNLRSTLLLPLSE